jgi:hypothetical protein
MHSYPQDPPPPPPHRPGEALDPFTMGAMISEAVTHLDTNNQLLAAIQQDIRQIPREVAVHMLALSRHREEGKQRMGTRIERVTKFMSAAWPYVVLLLVALAKFQFPDQLPLLRLLLLRGDG